MIFPLNPPDIQGLSHISHRFPISFHMSHRFPISFPYPIDVPSFFPSNSFSKVGPKPLGMLQHRVFHRCAHLRLLGPIAAAVHVAALAQGADGASLTTWAAGWDISILSPAITPDFCEVTYRQLERKRHLPAREVIFLGQCPLDHWRSPNLEPHEPWILEIQDPIRGVLWAKSQLGLW